MTNPAETPKETTPDIEWTVEADGRRYCIVEKAPHYTGGGEVIARKIEFLETAKLMASARRLTRERDELKAALESMKLAADALRQHVPGYHENDDKHERIHAAFAQHLKALAEFHAALKE